LQSRRRCFSASAHAKSASRRPRPEAPPPRVPEILAPFEKVLDGALTAYNAGDVTSFNSYFAKNARPPADEHTFQAIFDGIYQPELGNYVARRNLAVESVPDPNYGQIVDVAEFAKHTHVKVTANFQREDGALKIVQLRFEKM
jgi:hypothetical protein